MRQAPTCVLDRINVPERPKHTRVVTPVSLLLSFAFIASHGCYHYVDSDTPPGIGTHVELTLSNDAEERFRKRGINFVHYFTTGSGALDGVVLERSSDSVLVQIASVRIESLLEPTLYQHVSLAHSDVTQVKHRKVNPAATFALFGIIGSVVTLTVFEGLGIGSKDCIAVPTSAEC